MNSISEEDKEKLEKLREAWMAAKPEDKAKWMQQIDEVLDQYVQFSKN